MARSAQSGLPGADRGGGPGQRAVPRTGSQQDETGQLTSAARGQVTGQEGAPGVAHEEDGDTGPGPPSRIQDGAHVGDDPLPTTPLGDEAEGTGGCGRAVASVVLGQDRIALLHR